ncbi:hypothetical protein EN866_33950 [Mesorhizobium sp. M2D.F.Ca.ET.223.01.1.1]|uniref:hypothetical protein n=1 Tax=Mesorhizobium sp. M2D.F.Ca.ET.223.01.1.1 TaxID=2563940 RepID=UPI0010929640|nr:hypothetical protein [Mesorhizobium sp. M2D.F.Ca.ET.223.01.1.1]TGR83587.1 hypothetical protein EN866_33950 [Mesorhizobium sp. M2D.F.Ca.ET.223.01.1.1]TGT75180.1 hypothetical protein EN802_09250 [bacterium M00.F.Ca.ET.159.01.1.1]TGT88047.1 hypothetical protein EN800_06140 [bacterium M00.F.Ca.ET.157.01.1.1]
MAVALAARGFKLPRFEPWRLLKPLRMFDGQFYPYQPIQFMDGLLNPIIGAGNPPVQRTFLGALTQNVASTGYNYGNFSPVSAGLLVVGCIGRAGAGRTVSSISVGGSSQTLLTNPSGDQNPNALVCVPVSAGSYAVSCTFSGGCTHSVAFGWLLQNVQNNTPVSVFGANFNPGGVSSVTGSVNIMAGGSVCAIHMHPNTSGTTWTGLTEEYDAVTTVSYSAADGDFVSDQTGYNVTAAWTSNNSYALSVGSWR